MATKKAGGSVKNTRDSKSKRLGVKRTGGQPINAGGIIIRQRGNKYWAGENVGTGKDHTLYALETGVVKYTEEAKRKFDGNVYKKTFVNVVPATSAK